MEMGSCSNQMADAQPGVSPGRPPPTLVILAQARIHTGWTPHWVAAYAGKAAIVIVAAYWPLLRRSLCSLISTSTIQQR